MSRYTGPRWKQSRRLGLSLSGTGKELARRPYAPGDHGANNRRKISEYGQQLREKQKLRWMYGLNERQFQNLFLRAGKIKEGTHGDNFMILLKPVWTIWFSAWVWLPAVRKHANLLTTVTSPLMASASISLLMK